MVLIVSDNYKTIYSRFCVHINLNKNHVAKFSEFSQAYFYLLAIYIILKFYYDSLLL